MPSDAVNSTRSSISSSSGIARRRGGRGRGRGGARSGAGGAAAGPRGSGGRQGGRGEGGGLGLRQMDIASSFKAGAQRALSDSTRRGGAECIFLFDCF